MTNDQLVFVTTAAITLIALPQFIWLYRTRSTRRWKAALDAYAVREITRDHRTKTSQEDSLSWNLSRGNSHLRKKG
jgi:hypothetical protein